ncbi:hypothetical protein PAXRUDRAFT_803816 [Paxillus rubicundulus Ve08.2h10]|uniref:Uncharacterized protein n=1 Tax=Paxillus rubicundulus Ve08.2h10 TaxID=930991 RepID=A0A0D0CKU2_9AGAM|nr:hypothetical protein PAXRUDRAFT_803816 [Paxillus rubicundulus Ve08.2h10]
MEVIHVMEIILSSNLGRHVCGIGRHMVTSGEATEIEKCDYISNSHSVSQLRQNHPLDGKQMMKQRPLLAYNGPFQMKINDARGIGS